MSKDSSEGDANMQNDQGEKSENLDLRAEELQFANNAKNDPEEWLEHCRENVNKYRKLLQDSKSSYYKKDGDVGYLVNMKWLEKWKKLNYYDKNYRGFVPEFDPEMPTEVGEIDNEALLRPRQEILLDVDSESYYNTILKKNLKMNFDYKVVDEDIWNFFHSKYGGTPIKRFYHKTYSYGAEIEAKLKEFKVVILPTLENWDLTKVSQPFSIFSSKYESLETLLERICKNLNSDQYGYSLKIEEIRPWKLAFNMDIADIDNKLQETLNDSEDMNNNQDAGNKNDEEEESSSGISFPGISLDNMRPFKLDELELSKADTLIIEVASPETKKFIFYLKKEVILCHGKCEYCYSLKPLTVQCRCEEVMYCGSDCMKKDERFHLDK